MSALAHRLHENTRRKVSARLRAIGKIDILLGGVVCGLIERTHAGWKWTSWDGPARAGKKRFASAAAAADARWGVAARDAVAALVRADENLDAAVAAEREGKGSVDGVLEAWRDLKPHLRGEAGVMPAATSDPVGFPDEQVKR